MIRKLTIVLLVAGLAASPAVAKDKDKGNKGKAKGKPDTTVHVVETQASRPSSGASPGSAWCSSRTAIREVVRTITSTRTAQGCPPGLAKKNNGCLPPGQAKKRYAVGTRLPQTVVYQPAPTILVQRLTPVPVGYRYVVVDGDVLLLNSASRLVVDAIRHLVN
jgi:Ni/Co efflux regulator RcnB